MLTIKENYLRAVRCEKPEWVPCFTTDCNVFKLPFWDETDENGRDFCNIYWLYDEYGHMPDANQPAMTDIADWHDTIKFPDFSTYDWEKLSYDFYHGPRYDPDKVNVCIANTAGIFLIPINMMGWVDGLCALYDDPEEHAALTQRLADFICEEIGYFGKYIHPDMIFTGDDFAAAEGPFISQETFEEVYKPGLKQIADAIHATGALAEFHCCGDCQYITKEVADCGYDVIQLPVPNERLIKDMQDLKGKLAMTGGWARHGEAGKVGASEKVVRESLHIALDTFGKDGGLVFWDGGIIGNTEDSKNKMKWLYDELDKYGHEIYK